METKTGQKLTVDANGLVFGKRETRDIDPEQIAICKRFLAQCKPTRTLRVFSYWLKHVIENWAGYIDPGGRRHYEYVSNGACIQAAIELGLAVTSAGDSFNAYVGVSRRSVRKLAAAGLGNEWAKDSPGKKLARRLIRDGWRFEYVVEEDS